METNTVLKIGIIGAESTGKTELCENLALHFDTVWVPEYAREYFNDSDIYNYSLNDLVSIAKRQILVEEQKKLEANRFLFCDTTLITLKIWAELEFNQSPDYIENELKRISYDHYFITDNQVPWVADAQRLNKHSRDLLFQLNLAEVQKIGTPFTIISGIKDQRLKTAIQSLSKLL